ncbi:MAG: hypothetical protein WCO96_03975 [Actinomycetes bacterium]
MRIRSGMRVAIVVLLASLTAPLVFSKAAPSAGGGSVAALPMVGTLDAEGIVFGAISRGGEAGDSWAYRPLPLDTSEPLVGGKRLEFGPVSASSADPQLGLFTESGDGWRLVAVPLDTAGKPMRGPTPNPRGTRMDQSGSAVIVGRDPSRPAGSQLELIARPPGGEFRELPSPPSGVLLKAGDPSPSDPGEALAGNQGIGKVNAAVATESGRAVVFVAPVGRDSNSGVVVNDGSGGDGAWKREPIDPAGTVQPTVEAIGTDGTVTGAWIVGRAASQPVTVHRRDADSDSWKPLELPATPLTDGSAASAAGIDSVAPLGGKAQTVTVVDRDHGWVDLSFEKDGVTRQATLWIDATKPVGQRIESWCAEDFCDHPLGFQFAETDGYRSYAWGSGGSRERAVTNPLTPDGRGDSNQGTWMKLVGDGFEREVGGGGNYRPWGAFSSPESGWLQGPIELADGISQPERFSDWPVSARAPLTSVAAEPGSEGGAPVASIDRGAIAVGLDGQVARYTAASGWTREFLQSSSGGVVSANLRGVAWPQADLAYAVGDQGAMWRWRADTGLWERDPGAPVGMEENLMAVAFDPNDPQRGYAVGKGGTILAASKSWDQEELPPAFAAAKFTGVAFAGSEAVAVSDRGVLFNLDGEWKTDPQLTAQLATLERASVSLTAVAALPDGSVVLGGRSVVIKRDGGSGAWTFSGQPLPGGTVIALSAFRDGGRLRAMVSLTGRLGWPLADPEVEPDPNSPPPLLPPYLLPGEGYVLRETDDGWRDEERSAFGGSGPDRPLKPDTTLAFLLDEAGSGWAVGGWSGFADDAGRGAPVRSSSATKVRQRVQTAAIRRYSPSDSPAVPKSAVAVPVQMPGGVVRIAVGGHPQCESSCAYLSNQEIAPDRMLSGALDLAGSLAAQDHGPLAFVSTGSRIRPGSGFEGDASEEARHAQLLAPRSGLPVFSAAALGDVSGGSLASFRQAFKAASSPMGSSDPGSTIDRVGVRSLGPLGSGARTHYAFDARGSDGSVRVVVIDNSAGSLAASDPYQNPAEPQEQWLVNVLDDAAAQRVPAIVIGSRDLNSRARPVLNAADDADQIASLLVKHGASAYFHDRPEENRRSTIPAGAAKTIPQFSTGTLGYRSSLADSSSLGLPDALFGSAGFLLAEVDSKQRDEATNIAPVSVRLLPIIDNLSMLALDGDQVRRSRPALFQGIGRRPLAGDRWGEPGGDSLPNPSGADPYTSFPADPCRVTGCSTRIDPEFSFKSKDPDLLDFVAQDTASNNLRKPLIGTDDKVIRDPSSGLACPFNSGKTVVSLAAGGRSFALPVEVLGGSVLRPCGTVPLDPSRFEPAPSPGPNGAPPPAASPLPAVLPALVPPPPPPAQKTPSLFDGFTFGGSPQPSAAAPVSPPPPPPTFFANPVPPGGSTVKVEKREEEVAPESSSAASAYRSDDHLPVEPFVVGMMIIAALAGTSVRPGRRRDPAYSMNRRIQ